MHGAKVKNVSHSCDFFHLGGFRNLSVEDENSSLNRTIYIQLPT
jgi:hypothetical protein